MNSRSADKVLAQRLTDTQSSRQLPLNVTRTHAHTHTTTHTHTQTQTHTQDANCVDARSRQALL